MQPKNNQISPMTPGREQDAWEQNNVRVLGCGAVKARQETEGREPEDKTPTCLGMGVGVQGGPQSRDLMRNRNVDEQLFHFLLFSLESFSADQLEVVPKEENQIDSECHQTENKTIGDQVSGARKKLRSGVRWKGLKSRVGCESSKQNGTRSLQDSIQA